MHIKLAKLTSFNRCRHADDIHFLTQNTLNKIHSPILLFYFALLLFMQCSGILWYAFRILLPSCSELVGCFNVDIVISFIGRQGAHVWWWSRGVLPDPLNDINLPHPTHTILKATPPFPQSCNKILPYLKLHSLMKTSHFHNQSNYLNLILHI